MKERLQGGDALLSPENIESHDFRVPSIKWRSGEYELYGMGLPHNWEDKIDKIKSLYFGHVGKQFEEKTGTECELIQDTKTGLIRELSIISQGKKSRVFLETMMPRNGFYLFDKINDLWLATECLGLFSRYLSAATDFQVKYPYILSNGRGGCGSQDLEVPGQFMANAEKITHEKYQEYFFLKASNIAGQFGVELENEKLRFDDRGILNFAQVSGDRCTYDLDYSTRRYYPHNVDSVFQAGALHGIVAEFINDLLRRESNESWR